MDPSREMRTFVRDGVFVGTVCAFVTWYVYVSLYLLDYKAPHSATRITTMHVRLVDLRHCVTIDALTIVGDTSKFYGFSSNTEPT